jgi:hypothetical protein
MFTLLTGLSGASNDSDTRRVAPPSAVPTNTIQERLPSDLGDVLVIRANQVEEKQKQATTPPQGFQEDTLQNVVDAAFLAGAAASTTVSPIAGLPFAMIGMVANTEKQSAIKARQEHEHLQASLQKKLE